MELNGRIMIVRAAGDMYQSDCFRISASRCARKPTGFDLEASALSVDLEALALRQAGRGDAGRCR
jgi:hypothetical protein